MLGYEEAKELAGRDVVSSDGERLGKLEDAYVDHETRQAEWVLVTADLLGRRQYLVPLRDAQVDGGAVRVAYAAEQVRSQPVLDAEGEILPEEEEALYAHYHLRLEHDHPFDDGIPRDGLEPWPHCRRLAELGRIIRPEGPPPTHSED